MRAIFLDVPSNKSSSSTLRWVDVGREYHHQSFLKRDKEGYFNTCTRMHPPTHLCTHPKSHYVMIKQQLDSVRRGGTGCTWPGKKQMYSELQRSQNATYCTTTMNITSFPRLLYLEQGPFSTSYTSIQDTKKICPISNLHLGVEAYPSVYNQLLKCRSQVQLVFYVMYGLVATVGILGNCALIISCCRWKWRKKIRNM